MTRENVRLVIWDLDDTFWAGTVTEGGHIYNRDHHDIVVELARRGIMSSICSKNDAATIRAILEAEGLWEYFVFPSVNWEPKGPRIASLIDDMQLRPASVLFVDDNPVNRNEAKYYVPDLQVEDETCIGGLLGSPLLRGKDDSNLTRLNQYRLLERRKTDEKAAEGDNRNFLRQSGIKVTIDYDVEGKVDRAIELVNRTNQLNFTKARLSEDAEAARTELLAVVNTSYAQAGLIHVKDNYGDYGYCGFFVVNTGGSADKLLHFCFSCRILNMGVESWLYHQLGQPKLTIVGEVITDIFAEKEPPDWINLATADNVDHVGLAVNASEVIAHGGCNIASLARYFLVNGGNVVNEFNIARHGVEIFRNHSMFLRYAALGVTEAEREELLAMGYLPEDWATALFPPQSERPLWLMSFWADADAKLYRHKKLGLLIPFSLRLLPGGPPDLTKAEISHLPDHLRTEWAIGALGRLKADYEPAGLIDEETFKANIRLVMRQAPSDGTVFIILNNETRIDEQGVRRAMPWKAAANEYTRRAVEGYPNVELLNVMDFVSGDHDLDRRDPNHFGRLVHHRIYKHIASRLASKQNEAKAFDLYAAD